MSLHVEKGSLLECDEMVQQFILSLEEKGRVNGGRPFVLEKLGARGLFVKTEAIAEIERQIDAMLDANTYHPSANPED